MRAAFIGGYTKEPKGWDDRDGIRCLTFNRDNAVDSGRGFANVYRVNAMALQPVRFVRQSCCGPVQVAADPAPKNDPSEKARRGHICSRSALARHIGHGGGRAHATPGTDASGYLARIFCFASSDRDERQVCPTGS